MKGGNVDAIPKRPEEQKREIITRNARGDSLLTRPAAVKHESRLDDLLRGKAMS